MTTKLSHEVIEPQRFEILYQTLSHHVTQARQAVLRSIDTEYETVFH
jgi:hypothetical protein